MRRSRLNLKSSMEEGRGCLLRCVTVGFCLPLHCHRHMSHPAAGRTIRTLTSMLPDIPRRHGGSNFELSRHGGSHYGDGGPTDLERSYRASSNYEGRTGRSQALAFAARLARMLAAFPPSCQIVHRWPWAASNEAAAIHLPDRNSFVFATKHLTRIVRLAMQAAGSPWEAVPIQTSTPDLFYVPSSVI